MESATDGFALYDKKLNVIELNDAALKLSPSGTGKEDLVGKNLLELAPNIKIRGDYDRCMRVVETGQPFSIDDYKYYTKFGEERHLNIKAFRVRDGIGVITTDITERQQAEDTLKKKRSRIGF